MKGMSSIVKKTTQLLSGLVFLYGIYIITHGHLTPGGGFAGGTIIAASLFLLVLAFGSDELTIVKRKEGSSVTESLAILAFLLFGTFALIIGTNIFFHNYLPKGITGDLISAGIIPVYNILVGIEVAAALFTIILAFIIYKEDISK